MKQSLGFWDHDKPNNVCCLQKATYVLKLAQQQFHEAYKKQRAIARFSTEAEYKALATVASESMWILSLFQELKFSLSKPPY